MTEHVDIFAALAAPFPEERIRRGGGGRDLTYITARMAMNRLDVVVGPHNWRNTTRSVELAKGVGGVVCTIELRIDGEWIAKEDVGGFKEMTEKTRAGAEVDDDENTVKTAYSDAFKRAAVLWGVGRYLYQEGYPNFLQAPGPFQNDEPPPARPEPRPNPPAQASTNGQGQGSHHAEGRPPTSGRQLFAWAADFDKDKSKGLLRSLMEWAKLQRPPIDARMVDWPDDVIRPAYLEAFRIMGVKPLSGGADDGPSDDDLTVARKTLSDLLHRLSSEWNAGEVTREKLLDTLRILGQSGKLQHVESIRACPDLPLLQSYVAEAQKAIEHAASDRANGGATP